MEGVTCCPSARPPSFSRRAPCSPPPALRQRSPSPALGSGSADYPSDTSTQTSKPAKRGKPGKRPRRLTSAQLSAVAAKLGVSVDALKAAQTKAKAAADATDARETPAQMDELLATLLGVTAAQVREAFASVAPQRRGEGGGRGDCPGKPPAAGSGSGAGADYPGA